MNTDVMFSSKTDLWPTPQSFFDELNAEFNFTLDPCATQDNAKCAKYYTKDDDGLAHDWSRDIVFMNLPYGDPEIPCRSNCAKKRCHERGYHINEYIPGIADFIRKAHEESQKGATVVCLVPARTDTRWFHDYVYGKADEIRFIKGRLKFGEATNSAPFPSMVVVYRGVNTK